MFRRRRAKLALAVTLGLAVFLNAHRLAGYLNTLHDIHQLEEPRRSAWTSIARDVPAPSRSESGSGLESDELNAAASADFLRGVAPGSRKLYERALRGDGTFECLDGSGSVGSESLNDDFCDCEDGSDEPGTSACASGKFYCLSANNKLGVTISSMFVDDGVCDCCDGTDEPRGRCPSTCHRNRAGRDRIYAGPDARAKPRPAAGSVPVTRVLLGVPTVPRREDYLDRTLSALLRELPAEDSRHPLRDKVRVLVMNNSPGAHDSFYRLKFRWSTGRDPKARHYVDFVENPGHCKDPTPLAPEPDDLDNPTNRPGRQVRKQNCDLVSLLDHARADPFTHFAFLEDDFVACENAASIVAYLVRKVARIDASWLAIRFSFGMNGVLLPREALSDFHAHLRQGISRLPPDLLYQEWLEREKEEAGRVEYVYEHNLLDHVGEVSSFDVRPERRGWPKCHQPLADAWSLGGIERFDRRACGHSDVSPCPRPTDPERWNGTSSLG